MSQKIEPSRSTPSPEQGKADPKGSVEAWEELLKTNPDYPQRQQVEQDIAKAKGHSARG